MTENKYPTLAEYEKIADEWCAIERFFDESDYVVPADSSDFCLQRLTDHQLQVALSEHFGIDLNELEAERRQLLEEAMGA